MHKVKILFLVAVSFFLFAAGYRLLAVQPAQAQTGLVSVANIDRYVYLAVVGRNVFVGYQGTVPGPVSGQALSEPVPGSSPVVAVWGDGNTLAVAEYAAILEDGDVYNWNATDASWVLVGNLIGGPVPTMPASLGQVKARWTNHGVPQHGEGARRITRDGR